MLELLSLRSTRSLRRLGRPASFLFAATLLITVACGGEEGLDDEPVEDDGRTGGGGRTIGSSSGEEDDPWLGSSSGTLGSSSGSTDDPDDGSSSSGGPSSSSGGPDDDFCNDPDDVGGMDNPYYTGEISDRIDDQAQLTGVLSTDDVDVYSRVILDQVGGILKPTANTNAIDAELCVFLECVEKNGNNWVYRGPLRNFKCEKGTLSNESTDALKGCCGSEIEISPSCSANPASSDNVRAYTRIRATAPQCQPYTIYTGQ